MFVCKNLWAKIIVIIFNQILFFLQLARRVWCLRYWHTAISHNRARMHAWASPIHHFSLCLRLEFCFSTFLVEFWVVNVLSSILVDKVWLVNLFAEEVWAWRHGFFFYGTVPCFILSTVGLVLFSVLIRIEFFRRLKHNSLMLRRFPLLRKSTHGLSWQLWFINVVIWGLIF